MSDLQRAPGIGPSIEQDLRDLGITDLATLRRQDPEQLYQRLMDLRGTHIDRCVLYVFRCGVYFASRKRHQAHLLKWWHWKNRKLKVS